MVISIVSMILSEGFGLLLRHVHLLLNLSLETIGGHLDDRRLVAGVALTPKQNSNGSNK